MVVVEVVVEGRSMVALVDILVSNTVRIDPFPLQRNGFKRCAYLQY